MMTKDTWTQDEIINVLQDDVGNELFDSNKQLKYNQRFLN